MQLQKQLSRRYGGKDYAKWLVVIPPSLVDKLGWREGEELEARIQGDGLRLRRQKKPAPRGVKP